MSLNQKSTWLLYHRNDEAAAEIRKTKEGFWRDCAFPSFEIWSLGPRSRSSCANRWCLSAEEPISSMSGLAPQSALGLEGWRP